MQSFAQAICFKCTTLQLELQHCLHDLDSRMTVLSLAQRCKSMPWSSMIEVCKGLGTNKSDSGLPGDAVSAAKARMCALVRRRVPHIGQ